MSEGAIVTAVEGVCVCVVWVCGGRCVVCGGRCVVCGGVCGGRCVVCVGIYSHSELRLPDATLATSHYNEVKISNFSNINVA